MAVMVRKLKRLIVILFLTALALTMDMALFLLTKIKKALFFPGG
jgi:hypothetical protein